MHVFGRTYIKIRLFKIPKYVFQKYDIFEEYKFVFPKYDWSKGKYAHACLDGIKYV